MAVYPRGCCAPTCCLHVRKQTSATQRYLPFRCTARRANAASAALREISAFSSWIHCLAYAQQGRLGTLNNMLPLALIPGALKLCARTAFNCGLSRGTSAPFY